MQISFLGAAKTVTGSNFLIETENKKFLVDCGMFQGQAKEIFLNTNDFSYDPTNIDFMLLTHAHIDHSGRIPKLYNDGFKGPIYATQATVDLCGIMLPDSGHIQETEVQWLNKKRIRQGKHEVPPLYTYQDAVDCLEIFKGVNYGETIQIDENIKVRFNDAGHMLGSSILEIWVTEDGKEEKIVFTGDLGNSRTTLLKDHDIIKDCDYLVMESTYGNRVHEEDEPKAEKFLEIVYETIEKGGNVIIPSFAVGRTQEILFELYKIKEKSVDPKFDKKYERLMNTPVYVDSPLAISATEIFEKHLELFDDETKKILKSGPDPLEFSGVKFTRTWQESRELNETANGSIIISASGMCEVGRIKHHLKHNLWRPDSTILFVGYQAEGTLGKKIVSGEKIVKIFGDEITVNARIEYLEAFSGHADMNELIKFVEDMVTKPKKIFLVHGEPEGQANLRELLENKFELQVQIPNFGEVFDITQRAEKTGIIRPKHEEKYIRLQIAELLEQLGEDMVVMKNAIMLELKQDTEQDKVKEIKYKLHELQARMEELKR